MAPGYDNQPFYTPDGAAVLFTANRDGKQTDIYEFDRVSRRVRQAGRDARRRVFRNHHARWQSLQRDPCRSRRHTAPVALRPRQPKVVLPEIKPVGYHAWVDADRLVLFVLGKPSTLQTAQVATGKGTVVASDVGRSILRMPGGNSISFVERLETGEYWVKELNPMTGASTPWSSRRPARPSATARGCPMGRF